MSISKEQAKRVLYQLGSDMEETDINEFWMGIKTEMEHTDVTHGNLKLTGQIALAHLKEFPDYYTRLKEMEKWLGEG